MRMSGRGASGSLQADDEVEAAAAVRRDAGDAVLAAQFVFFVRDGDFDEGSVCREFGAGKAQMVERLFAVGIQAAAAGEGGGNARRLRRDVQRGLQVFAQLFLPVGDGLRVEVIDGGDRAFACGAEALQFLVKQVAVGAVVRVAFVAQGEEVVTGVGERGAAFL